MLGVMLDCIHGLIPYAAPDIMLGIIVPAIMVGIMVPAIISGIMPEAMLGDIPVMPEAMPGDIPAMPEAMPGDIPVMPDAVSPGAYMACVVGNCNIHANSYWLYTIRENTVAAVTSCRQPTHK